MNPIKYQIFLFIYRTIELVKQIKSFINNWIDKYRYNRVNKIFEDLVQSLGMNIQTIGSDESDLLLLISVNIATRNSFSSRAYAKYIASIRRYQGKIN